MNGAQRCEMHNRAACSVLLLPFWSKATLRATLKDLPPTQRCRDSVSLDCGCDGKRFSSAALNKKGTFSHLGGRAGCSTTKDCGVLRSMISSEDDALLTF